MKIFDGQASKHYVSKTYNPKLESRAVTFRGSYSQTVKGDVKKMSIRALSRIKYYFAGEAMNIKGRTDCRSRCNRIVIFDAR